MLDKQENTIFAQNLAEKRKSIRQIDENIIKLLQQRMEVAKQIGKLKSEYKKPIIDKARENEHISHLCSYGKQLGLSQILITDLFQIVMQHSVTAQENINLIK